MKTRVAVIFGGISVEHEVSVISALQAVQNMNSEKYEITPIYISKDRKWYTGDVLLDIENYKDLKKLMQEAQPVRMQRTADSRVIVEKDPRPRFGKAELAEVDVAFPVIHGTFGEDGVLQGYLELLGLPYVGCDVISSGAGMDKVLMKRIYRDAQLPILDFVTFYSSQWNDDNTGWLNQIEESIGYPVIVKPANLGSSVGISKAENREELEEAIDLAQRFAQKLVVEPMVSNMTEVNCSVVGDPSEVEASVCEQVLGTDEFLSYEDKYTGGGKDGGSSKGMESTNRVIPAEIGEGKTAEVQRLAKAAFQTLGASGVARIDFIIDENSGTVYINEINTIPGSLSFYLWEPAGRPYPELIDRLIQLALKRERERGQLMFSIDSNLFSMQNGGAKGSKGSKQS
ncbi:D-alanine--D-alanine ligase family protein [Alkalicoccus urumqiensis]|uniref:D-alanine--D-alanine ligase n=1 Tax=Alkalicoccus urumqiensis TaxID=1548213 RepID=A0A2P6MGB1_ALKUR|nr:D-alanine--D-alanine ligase family protein [Alkalicoccus urumqiensis]PRO65335.1 D-alanine--D-alanine ligase [Alkalicoccus urumqiensis]